MEKFVKCWVYKFFAAALLLSVAACQESTPVASSENDPEEAYAGGATTSFDVTSKAFTFPLANISSPDLQRHKDGDAVFEATFVTPPATVNGGLGPIYNNTSCKSCHNNDGRARPPLANEQFGGLLFRISVPGADTHGGPLPVPGYGLQVQNNAVFGVLPEMTIQISYTEIPGKFSDGTDYSLQKPTYTMVNPYIPVPSDVMLSPRMANANFGLGLLDAVTEQTILSYADENDANGDGISGKANYVYDQAQDKLVLGRYGWKASQPTLLQQSAAAANGDMGITSTYFPDEASKGQTQDVPAHEAELSADQLNALTVYLQTLAPPARRNAADGTVQKGRSLFIQAKCAACHLPKMQTGTSSFSELTNQTIRPYTDLLLHDMGDGLADGRPDFNATGNEWRTAPLWGIGLTQVVSGHTYFLHDGRARNLTEAILWHGGEAEKSKQAFVTMNATDRAALLKFLNSL
jgi:CxxC motif-containing protein (DUF1111 family)